MQYMLLIYVDESNYTPPASEEEAQDQLRPWFEYGAALQQAGVFVAGDALQPVATATTVRRRSGDTLHTDGPFAETKEQLGGYYLLECSDLDQALHWAARCPAADYGSIEVRPVQKFD